MRLPNFFIIGAPKCGTTTLYANLKGHPEIYMCPVKEPCYFLCSQEKKEIAELGGVFPETFEEYLSLFNDVAGERSIGEVSPQYLACEKSPHLIYESTPGAKIIVILRQPAERAYSTFNHGRMLELEPMRSFTEAWEEEAKQGRAARTHYRKDGLYYQGLVRWFELFNHDQIRVYLYEDLVFDARGLLGDICRFLNVDSQALPKQLIAANVTAVGVRSPLGAVLHFLTLNQTRTLRNGLKSIASYLGREDQLRSTYYKLWNANIIRPQPLSAGLKRDLTDFFKDDILKLQELIQRDLSHWLGG